jgi:integrase
VTPKEWADGRPAEKYSQGIAKLPGGLYRVRISIRGKRIKRTFPTRNDAIRFRNSVMVERAGGQAQKYLTMVEVWQAERERWERAGLAAATVNDYEDQVAKIGEVIDPYGSADLTQAEIEVYIDTRLAQGGGKARIAKELRFLRAAIKGAGVPPAWEEPRGELKHTRRLRHVYRDVEVAAIVDSLEGHREARRAVLLALLTGMRPREVRSASTAWLWRDETGAIAEIQIPAEFTAGERQKTGVSNRLPVVGMLREALDEVVGEGPLIRVGENALRSVLRRRSKRLRLEVECSGTETFRHTPATWAKDAGFTDDEIDVALSHFPHHSTAARYYTRQAQAVEPKRRIFEAVEARLLDALKRIGAQEKPRE